jgi:hypothetical protein
VKSWVAILDDMSAVAEVPGSETESGDLGENTLGTFFTVLEKVVVDIEPRVETT